MRGMDEVEEPRAAGIGRRALFNRALLGVGAVVALGGLTGCPAPGGDDDDGDDDGGDDDD